MNFQPHEKTIYFIRHAEDEQGQEQLYQTHDSPLSERGKRQVELLAQWVPRFEGEVIITSPMTRARDTAEAIARTTHLPIVEEEDFREYLAPSSFRGTSRASNQSRAYSFEMLEHIHDPTWHYEDEENYHDLHARALRCLDCLMNHEASRILVVTHAGFMRVVLSAMMMARKPNPELVVTLMRFLKPNNTGITEVHWHPEPGWRNNWRLVTWNETPHLPKEEKTTGAVSP